MPESGTRPLPLPARVALQCLVLGGFAAFIGVFSAQPAYRLRGENDAIVKLSFSHAAQLQHPCRERNAEELKKLAPNMRTQLDCPRQRAVVRFEMEMDGKPTYRLELPPGGLRKDGPATVYRRAMVAAGTRRIAARLSDQPSGEFNHSKDAVVDLKPGQVLLVDFIPAEGGFIFTKE